MAEESNDASIYIYIYPLPRGQYRFGEGGEPMRITRGPKMRRNEELKSGEMKEEEEELAC